MCGRFLLSIYKTIDIFSCPAAIVLLRDVVDKCLHFIVYGEHLPCFSSNEVCHYGCSESALQVLQSNDGGVSIDAMITVQRGYCCTRWSPCTSLIASPMLGTSTPSLPVPGG
jgi:hypothetical protein